MRADMAKVIVERPRHGMRTRGAGKGYARSLQRIALEDRPYREGIKAHSRGGTKSFNEHLGPLRRYLDAQVGRPWNKVFGEICAHINRNSVVQDHVRDHVEDYVTTNVIEFDGVLCFGEGGYRHGRPLADFRWKPWYVCPRTGILRRVKARLKPTRPANTKKYPSFIRVDESHVCRVIDGVWHLVTLKPLPEERVGNQTRDVVLNQPLARLADDQARMIYGDRVYAVEARRLSRKELRQLPIPDEFWF